MMLSISANKTFKKDSSEEQTHKLSCHPMGADIDYLV